MLSEILMKSSVCCGPDDSRWSCILNSSYSLCAPIWTLVLHDPTVAF